MSISYINNEKTICKLNQRFRNFPYGRKLQEPKLLNFFLEARNAMISFYNKEILMNIYL